jgi:uncharacterized protein YjbI with pentapeptide repeats
MSDDIQNGLQINTILPAYANNNGLAGSIFTIVSQQNKVQFSSISGTNIYYKNASFNNISGVNASFDNLAISNLSLPNLTGNNLFYENITGTSIHFISLSGTGATIQNLTASNISTNNITATNGFFNTLTIINPLQLSDLKGTNLNFTNISGVNLLFTNASGNSSYLANLKSQNLSGTNISTVVLTGTFINATFISGTNARLGSLQTDSITGSGIITGFSLVNVSNISGNNIYSSIITASNVYVQNLNINNITAVNLVSANIITNNITSTNGFINNLSGISANFASYNLTTATILGVKTTGSNGGTFTGSTWLTRTLNEFTGSNVYNQYISLDGANGIVLTAGKYNIQASAPAFGVGSHQIRLYNITNNSLVVHGTSEYSSNSQTRSFVSTPLFLNSTCTLQLQHYATSTVQNNGLGNAMGIGQEIYGTVNIQLV